MYKDGLTKKEKIAILNKNEGWKRFQKQFQEGRGQGMTIKDIAESCGVSVSTVSRVLNDHPDVSPKVRQKVLEAARRAHYVPNNSARDLVKARSEGIGLIVRGVGNPFFTQIIHSIERAIDAAGYSLALHQISTNEDEILAGATLARSKKLKGLIFLGGKGDYQSSDIAILDVPFVCCTYTVRFTQLPRESYSSVAIDDKMEGYRATKLLLEKGHRKIGVIMNSKHDRSIGELRYMGYCEALEEAGIPVDETLLEEVGSFGLAATYEATCRLLERRSDLTAIFAYSDSMALAAIKALSDHGRRVPEDCSVIAIDGIEMTAYSIPTLTTMAQPQSELGITAVRTLVDMIEGRASNRHILLPATPRLGGSVAAM